MFACASLKLALNLRALLGEFFLITKCHKDAIILQIKGLVINFQINLVEHFGAIGIFEY